MDKIATSKFLSYILRHRPDSIGLSLDSEGWVKVTELLTAMELHGKSLTKEQLFYIVETSDKQRFALSADQKRIRANQGHSINNIDLGYEQISPPAILYHGTATRFVNSIRIQGLTKQNRHHVHLSENKETAQLVGRRHGKLALLTIDSAKMHLNKFMFYKSENGVWLTEQVPPKYIIFPEH